MEDATVLLRSALTQYFETTSLTKAKSGHGAERSRIRTLSRSVLGSKPLATITRFDVAAYRNHRTREGRSPATVKLEPALLSHLFETARAEWPDCGTLANPV